jgi:hypothetical protein
MAMTMPGSPASTISTFRGVLGRLVVGNFARTSVLAFLAGSVGIACPAAKSHLAAHIAPAISHSKSSWK